MVSAIVIIGCSIVSTLVVIMITVLICNECCNSKSTKERIVNENLTRRIIPPIYYTEDIKDPLMQDDLRDSIKP